MFVPVSVCLFSGGAYSQSNGPSYLCNGSAERTPSVEISFVIWNAYNKRTRVCVYVCVYMHV